MATYYKYKSREGEDQIDWRGITQGITDDLTKIATDRENKRQAIDEAVLTNLETIADKPQGQDAGQNQIIANYAEQASSIALANQKLLKSGAITLKEYTARTNTAGSSTTKLFGLSKKYQDNYQRQMDRLKSIDGKPPEGSILAPAFIQQMERFSNPETTRYYMDPATGEAFLAKVGEDEAGIGQVKRIDGKAYSLMNVGSAENIITRDINRYQSGAVAANLASEAGILKQVLMDGNVGTRTDAFKRMFSIDENGDIIDSELSDIGRSTLNQIKATFASDMDYASMLADTMGKAAIAENADGTYTNIVTNQKYVGKPEDAIVFETINGQQQPKQSDNWEKQKAEAEREVLNQVKSKLGIEETINPNIQTQDQIDKNNLAQQRIDDAVERTRLQRLRDEKGKETVTSTIMADAKSYLEKNILLKDLEQSDDANVIKSINNILSEFGISISNPTNLFDGQSIQLTQVNADGKEVTEEILLPSDKSRDILLTNAPSSNAAKQSIITFILENVNARSLSALKNKLSPAPQETETDDPLDILEP
tara:strand:+ start:2980 stop:4596 length:1617 start_codon:yes stop_codon:yes gene_type:complete